MSLNELQPLVKVRRFRTIPQLIVEWIIGLVAFFSIFIGLLAIRSPLSALPPILFGAVIAYGLMKLRERWSRVPITVYRGGHVSIGGELITRDRISGLQVEDLRTEPGLIIGSSVLNYVNVVDASLNLVDGTRRKLRLLEKDFRKISSFLGNEDTAMAEAS